VSRIIFLIFYELHTINYELERTPSIARRERWGL